MNISQLNPIEVQSHISDFNNNDDMIKDCIKVGRGNNGMFYSSELTFPPILVNDNQIVKRAVLKMFCKKEYGSDDYINICINNEHTCLEVEEIGDYEWDVTNVVNKNMDHLTLFAYTEDFMDCYCIKEFEVFAYNTRPVLEVVLSYKEPEPEPKCKIVDIVREYKVDKCVRYSEWIDTILFNNHYYFIKNLGGSDVEIILEISPDKQIIIQDSVPLIITPNEVVYLQAMRASQFVRLSYTNVSMLYPNLIKVWFQGEK